MAWGPSIPALLRNLNLLSLFPHCSGERETSPQGPGALVHLSDIYLLGTYLDCELRCSKEQAGAALLVRKRWAAPLRRQIGLLLIVIKQ